MVIAKTGAPFKFEISAPAKRTRSFPAPTSPFCAKSASTRRYASSTRANTSTASPISITTSSPTCCSNRNRPATSSAILGARRPPTQRIAQLFRIKDPVVDARVDRIIFATDRDDLVARHPRARPGPALELLCRATILPGGGVAGLLETSSAFPRSSQATAASISIPGGSTPRRKGAGGQVQG